MHKPPGLYYQFVLLRWVFSFGYIFYIYLTAVPSLVGDLLIATVLYSVFTRYASKGAAQAIVVLYLMSAGIFLASAIVNRVDCIPIALLALAVLNQGEGGSSCISAWLLRRSRLLYLPFRGFSSMGKPLKNPFGWAGYPSGLSPYLLDDPQLFAQRLALPQLK